MPDAPGAPGPSARGLFPTADPGNTNSLEFTPMKEPELQQMTMWGQSHGAQGFHQTRTEENGIVTNRNRSPQSAQPRLDPGLLGRWTLVSLAGAH